METAINMEIKVDTKKFWKDGYLLLRNVFQKEEVEGFRRAIQESEDLSGDMLSNPRLRGVLLDDRILGIAATILGQTPVYWGESTAQKNLNKRGWHKDNVDRENINGPDWQGNHTILKFALYPQDHSQHSGGLNLRRRSHNTTAMEGPPKVVGENVYMDTRMGDIVVWNMRATHSGCGFILKFPRRLQVEPDLGPRLPYSLDLVGRTSLKLFGRGTSLARLPNFLIAQPERERYALLFTFGVDDHHLERHLAYVKTRKYMVDLWKNSHYDDAVWEAVKEKNIIVKDVWSEIKDQPGLGLEDFDYSY